MFLNYHKCEFNLISFMDYWYDYQLLRLWDESFISFQISFVIPFVWFIWYWFVWGCCFLGCIEQFLFWNFWSEFSMCFGCLIYCWKSFNLCVVLIVWRNRDKTNNEARKTCLGINWFLITILYHCLGWGHKPCCT